MLRDRDVEQDRRPGRRKAAEALEDGVDGCGEAARAAEEVGNASEKRDQDPGEGHEQEAVLDRELAVAPNPFRESARSERDPERH